MEGHVLTSRIERNLRCSKEIQRYKVLQKHTKQIHTQWLYQGCGSGSWKRKRWKRKRENPTASAST